MQTTKASNRYAQALFEIATENGSVNDVLGDLKMISETFWMYIDSGHYGSHKECQVQFRRQLVPWGRIWSESFAFI